MAQRRMFSKKITDTDIFLDMPLSSQALYFHLNMHADDDGFVSNAKTVKRMIGSSDDDLKLLLTKNFIFAFESGVVVIKDWKIHNYIRKDTYNTTIYGDEKEQLSQDENGSYTLSPRAVDEPSPQVRLGKVRLGKDSNIYSSSNDEPHIDLKTFKEIISYLNEKAGTKYRASGSKTQRLIKARFNDGFNDEDFKKVINIKVAEWSGTDMAKYLRPETLFGTKFESYLNQEVKKSKTNKGGDSYGGLEF
ncbi:conserved phage C-terminal domain-containing protein [Pediococcus pentosaceus]|uniref:Conserved phage C-terminal domain-containing protein n=1 Tax=Pediococcus pentosaceus TaxID=1255 RepID=A0A6L5A3S2_PEDPE|nr:conserved phage C-terminal domain-containing protein [Pediococcus pentosaceus]KAF0348303.1 DNA replication protein [Pediococcus pentosaceus]KAF0415122.1 DNA replication protein [Pediococcus pentosaceus]KAF0501818.1 DNA replication protein [Pediococcus pentosaceus]MBF7105496.1 conserved phage C-terminal domain-containing protein [Pediococcus pentosaceus]MBF7126413.1 conserved phage C-terminal domain-containing protein [Pediococcus pentosaceus]